jgi:hypothetical protein
MTANDESPDPMAKIFPKSTTCLFHQFGPSGTITKFDSICILTINIINDKIYFCMYFWFLTLALITFVQLIIRAITILIPRKKETLLKNQAHVSYQVASIISNKLKYDDWFILYLLGKNMEPSFYKVFIEELAKEIKKKKNLDV